MAGPDADREELATLVRWLAVLPSVLFVTLAAVLVWEFLHGDETERPMHIILAAVLLAREQFLSIASHELKTPLTSLQLKLQTLVRLASGDERFSVRLQAAARSAGRLGELVDRLLDVSRMGSDSLDLVPEDTDLAEVAGAVAARFADVLEDSGSSLSLRLEEPVHGTWDRLRLDIAVSNLLSNAIKYGQGRPIDLGVQREGSLARVWVRDRGIGIDPADQERIFDRFERAVPERHYGGFGIGLWVARMVAEAHGGRIRVESRPAEGSTFVVELPLGGPR
jgi:signal transduction histidine kinase